MFHLPFNGYLSKLSKHTSFASAHRQLDCRQNHLMKKLTSIIQKKVSCGCLANFGFIESEEEQKHGKRMYDDCEGDEKKKKNRMD